MLDRVRPHHRAIWTRCDTAAHTATTRSLTGYAPLAFVAVVAAALRWFRIDTQSLWYDEGISAHQLTRTYPEILHAAALDTHPPGYYWTLKAWGDVFGGSDVALRSLSAFWGVIAVLLTFLIGRRLFGTVVGAVAALLLAAAPLAVYYSQEVRMYAQVTALGLLAVYAYMNRWYWLYALAGLATLYSQYLGVALLAAVNVHALIFLPRERSVWIRWFAANAAIGLGFLPWLPTFIDQQTHALNTSPRTPLGITVDSLTAYGGGIAHGDVFLWTGAGLVALSVLGFVLTRDTRAVSLAALIWLFPLGLVVALGFRSGLFEVRYLVVGLPGLALMVASTVARWRLLAPPLTAAALIPFGLALNAQYFDPSLARDDYRGLVASIEQRAEPDDAILLVAPNQIEVFGFYYHGPLPTIGLPAQRPIDVADATQRLAAIRSEYQRVWLVSWAMNEADPQGVIAGWLAENGFQATHQWFGTVQLALISFPSAASPEQRVNVSLDNGIVLDGYQLSSTHLRPGDTLDLTLMWRDPDGPTSEHWKVFTHLLDSGSKVVAQRDAEPADNLRPTTTWSRDEQVQDNYGIAIPPDLPAGSYTLEIGMYDGDKRAAIAGVGDHLVLGQVQVAP